MAAADVVVKGRYVADGSQGVPIEPRAIIAQWQGDHVTVWSSTQMPFAARSGVAHVLEIPESHVRIIVPLLGGGFGSKCDFHFEAHVAALARAAGRPVKLVFSRAGGVHRARPSARGHGDRARDRRAPRRHARRAARAGSCSTAARTAARAASSPRWRRCTRCGPYEIENVDVDVDARLHEQPAVRLDPRPHRAADLLGASSSTWTSSPRRSSMDPVELRRRTLIEEGAESPTRAGLRPARDASETLERAVELIGYGRGAARRRGDRRRLRLVAVVRRRRRART